MEKTQHEYLEYDQPEGVNVSLLGGGRVLVTEPGRCKQFRSHERHRPTFQRETRRHRVLRIEHHRRKPEIRETCFRGLVVCHENVCLLEVRKWQICQVVVRHELL